MSIITLWIIVLRVKMKDILELGHQDLSNNLKSLSGITKIKEGWKIVVLPTFFTASAFLK